MNFLETLSIGDEYQDGIADIHIVANSTFAFVGGRILLFFCSSSPVSLCLIKRVYSIFIPIFANPFIIHVCFCFVLFDGAENKDRKREIIMKLLLSFLASF